MVWGAPIDISSPENLFQGSIATMMACELLLFVPPDTLNFTHIFSTLLGHFHFSNLYVILMMHLD